MSLGPGPYLILASALFVAGGVGVLTRRNLLIAFLCAEMMLHAAVLSAATFSRRLDDVAGQSAATLLLLVATLEGVVAVAFVLALHRHHRSVGADR